MTPVKARFHQGFCYDPRQIGRFAAAVNHGSGNPETGTGHWCVIALQESLNDVLQTGCFAARKTLNGQGLGSLLPHHKKPDARLCSTDIPCQDNRALLLNRHLPDTLWTLSLNLLNRDLVNVLHPVIAVVAFCHGPKGETVSLRERFPVHFIGKENPV